MLADSGISRLSFILVQNFCECKSPLEFCRSRKPASLTHQNMSDISGAMLGEHFKSSLVENIQACKTTWTSEPSKFSALSEGVRTTVFEETSISIAKKSGYIKSVKRYQGQKHFFKNFTPVNPFHLDLIERAGLIHRSHRLLFDCQMIKNFDRSCIVLTISRHLYSHADDLL